MKATILLVVILMILWIIIWSVSALLKSRKDEIKAYESRYLRIQYFLDNCSVTSENYDICMGMLTRLGDMRYKNKEKTIVLSNHFFIKFKEERMKRISEECEELSPEETFRKL